MHQKVAPISEPLTEWLNSMDPQTVEALQKMLLPISVLTGIVAVVTPDIMVEMEFAKLKRQAYSVPPPSCREQILRRCTSPRRPHYHYIG